ncbi:MAG TPA: hypothetical protein VJP80_04470 [Candidatus Saccharimonadales bacterium]|nr:hypothetical protein [Candidatus Saccharimonadales bacterium]
MSELCKACPVEQGYPRGIEPLIICGTPTPQCHETMIRTSRKLNETMRLRQIAAIGGGRVVDLSLLQPHDEIELLSAPQLGVGYQINEEAEVSSLTLAVQEVSAKGYVTALVVSDNYFSDAFRHADGDEWPIPEGEPLLIYGSCDSTQLQVWRDEIYQPDEHHIAGMLHVGRQVTLERDSGVALCVIDLQELEITTPGGVIATMFDTDPGIYRLAFYEEK